jgi:hypothetical protein
MVEEMDNKAGITERIMKRILMIRESEQPINKELPISKLE